MTTPQFNQATPRSSDCRENDRLKRKTENKSIKLLRLHLAISQSLRKEVRALLCQLGSLISPFFEGLLGFQRISHFILSGSSRKWAFAQKNSLYNMNFYNNTYM
ncbi:hypothetical protein CEXT_362251 [Caerostris extrusa]|uniref:Uncharacterized protein n=1 Tax=Caerostris extrusa TaxID=172846 RepID=A0AAV4Y8A7_CAEEX|nr:hypothetical protein CEXT_362251 [Caerostris extrusa]